MAAAEINRQDNPAKKSTKIPLAATNSDVPRSGSFAINNTGTMIKAKVMTMLDREGGRSRLDKNQAHIIGIPSFINSEGCTLPNPGKLIQR